MNCMMFGDDVTNYKCWPVTDYVKYHVKEYGQVHGEEAIMSEVLERGPITCGMVCPDEFVYGYDGGIYKYHGNQTDMDHDVEIVGWGEEHGEKYWKIRNSWGSYWGENGFFRLVRGKNNLRVEESCVFAIPESKAEDKFLKGKLGGSMFGPRKVGHHKSPHEKFPDDYVSPKPEQPHNAPPPHADFAVPAEGSIHGTSLVLGVITVFMGVALLIWGIKHRKHSSEYEEI